MPTWLESAVLMRRDTVADLLQANRAAGRFMAELESENHATVDLIPDRGPRAQIGPYRLLQQIGEGGFGGHEKGIGTLAISPDARWEQSPEVVTRRLVCGT